LGLIAALTLVVAGDGCGDGSNGGGGAQSGEQAPVLAPVDANPSVVLGSDLLIPISATDPEGAPVTLSASGLPANSYFLPDSGVFCFLADDETQVGQSFPVTFTASDGSLTSSQTVTIHVVRPTTADAIALSALTEFTLAPIGDQSADPNDTFTLQLSATGADEIFYRMYPDPSVAPFVSLDPHTGVFTYSPTEEQAGKVGEVTFQACAVDNGDCSQIVQEHETIHLATTAGPGSCEATRTAFEGSIPTPGPTPGRYVVQLINESNVTLLAAANAAHRQNDPPKSVLPREGTWVLPPHGTLTIDIPEAWERTMPHGTLTTGGVGPVFWARTGCVYDIASDIAQCETGDCGGKYDCSKAGFTPTGAKSLAEWTFDDINHNAAPDISAVDGVNISMDIVPIPPYTEQAKSPNDPKTWLNDPKKRPMMVCGQDRRAGCPDAFALKRKQLTFFPVGNSGADNVVACFSNCGQYKFKGDLLKGGCLPGFRCAGEPDFECKPDLSTEFGRTCFYWKAFCCAVAEGDPHHVYNVPCKDDATCQQNGSCWDKFLPPKSAVCACKGFIKNATCPPDVCTLPYTEDKINQPMFGQCSELTNKTGRPQDCVGDDFFHEVMPRGLTWPNDPETYFSDAKAFRIVFAPGGTNVPITDSAPIPSCSTLPSKTYHPDEQAALCKQVAPDAVFGGGRPSPDCIKFCSNDRNKRCNDDSQCRPGLCSGSDCPCTANDCTGRFGCDLVTHHCNTWECDVKGQSNAVLCRWDNGTPPPTPTATGTPGAPTPTATPGPGCDQFPGQVLRLDADQITGLTAGAKVALWADQSARGNSVSQSNVTFQPSWQPSTFNGHATVRFGANGPSALTRATSVVPGNGPRTVLVVANRTVGGDGQTFVDLGTDGDGTEYLLSPEYSLRFGKGVGIVAWRPGTPVGNTPSVISLMQTGTEADSVVLYENGAPKTRSSIKSVALNTTGGTTIGHRTLTDFNNKTWALRGDIATVIVFERILTTGERCACEQQLGQRYGISVPACNS
jgi:hypothetical protein